jgi:eukaryotic-like serine/threonine-protein kinase
VKVAVDERTLPAVPGFQLVRRIGRGGMGEVFEAIRVGPRGFRKPVALKQLIPDHALSGRARQRFFEEAQVSAQLEHGNLVRVHDVVEAGGAFFIVMELLRGGNLVELVEGVRDNGPLRWATALSIAAQALEGLAYAHEAVDETGHTLGLVHRDLTPRNLFVCVGGTVKILDFGIAKRRGGPSLTGAGHVQGTIELLSPEQARGERVDKRSDLYQLGATLYWLLASRYPHGDGTPGEIIARAATCTPEAIGNLVPELPPAVVALVERAMARAPDDRFADASAMGAAIHEVLAAVPAAERGRLVLARIATLTSSANDEVRVETISATGEGTAATPGAPAPGHALPPANNHWMVTIGAVAIALAVGFVVAWVSPREESGATSAAVAKPPTWTQLSFGRTRIGGARFAPGGKTFVYSVTDQTGQMALYRGEAGNALGRPLGVVDADLLGISHLGEMLVLLGPRPSTELEWSGTLATVPLAGGAPRELLADVMSADVGPDGRTLAVARRNSERRWIEFPLGRTLIESRTGWYADLRVSPRGDLIAFVEHPARGDDRGTLKVIGADGVVRAIGTESGSVSGLAWVGDEVWMTAATTGRRRLVAVDLAGHDRVIASAPSNLRLADVARDGRVLVLTEELRLTLTVDRGDGHLVTIPPIGNVDFGAITADGRWLLGSDAWNSTTYHAFKMPADLSAPPTLLGDGLPRDSSPDGRWVAALSESRDRVRLLPLGPGTPIELPFGGMANLIATSWFHDSKRILVAAHTAAGKQLFAVETAGGTPVAIGRVGLTLPVAIASVIAPDSSEVFAIDGANGRSVFFDLRTARERPVLGIEPGDMFLAWTPDSRAVLVARGTATSDVTRIDATTGERKPWKVFRSDNPATCVTLRPYLSSDPTRYALGQAHVESVLYLAEGAR